MLHRLDAGLISRFSICSKFPVAILFTPTVKFFLQALFYVRISRIVAQIVQFVRIRLKIIQLFRHIFVVDIAIPARADGRYAAENARG